MTIVGLLLGSVGVYSTNNEMFGVVLTLPIGGVGYALIRLGFHPAPVLLGFVLGPRLEDNFRRALALSRGDLAAPGRTAARGGGGAALAEEP